MNVRNCSALCIPRIFSDKASSQEGVLPVNGSSSLSENTSSKCIENPSRAAGSRKQPSEYATFFRS